MQSASSSDLGTSELVQRAAMDAKELVRLEIALAKNELALELEAAKSSAIMGGIAVACALTGIGALVLALGLFLGPWVALGVASGLLVTAAVLGFFAYGRFPKKPMGLTGKRLANDETLLKEHLS